MTYDSNSVDEYIAQLPEDRITVLKKLRNLALKQLPKDFSEEIVYKMIGYTVPLETYSSGYHVGKDTPLPFLNFASQKNYVAMYHTGIYADKKLYDWFVTKYPKYFK